MSERLFDPAHVDGVGKIQFTLHQRLKDDEGQEYAYYQAGSAVAAGQVVRLLSDGTGAPLSNAAVIGNRVGVAMSALAKDEYGWASIYGRGNVEAGANAAKDVSLYPGGAAGTVDDTVRASQRVSGMVLTAPRGAGAGPAAAMWQYPQIVKD